MSIYVENECYTQPADSTAAAVRYLHHKGPQCFPVEINRETGLWSLDVLLWGMPAGNPTVHKYLESQTFL